jgi:hypothetical protein
MTLSSSTVLVKDESRAPQAPDALAQSMMHAGVDLKPSEIAAASSDKAAKVRRASALIQSMEASKMPTWLLPLSSLGPNLHEASELAAMLEELSPNILVDGRHPGIATQCLRTPTTPSRVQWSHSRPQGPGTGNIHDRSV